MILVMTLMKKLIPNLLMKVVKDKDEKIRKYADYVFYTVLFLFLVYILITGQVCKKELVLNCSEIDKLQQEGFYVQNQYNISYDAKQNSIEIIETDT